MKPMVSSVLTVKAAYTKSEARRWLARAPGPDDFAHVVRASTDYVDAETGRLVFRFVKGALRTRDVDRAREAYADIDTKVKPSVSRRAAAGEVSLEKMRALRADVASLKVLTPTTAQLVLEDGRTLAQTFSNPVHSHLAGYGVERFTGAAKVNMLTRRFPERWARALPFFVQVDRVLARELPEVHGRMLRRCDEHPAWTIDDTALSSVTINVNYESHYHYDVGDYLDGYSTLTVVEIGRYRGGLFVMPRYRVAIDVREGDVLLCQSHVDIHGNTPLDGEPGAKRVSFVTYLKHKLAAASNRLDPRPAVDHAEGRPLRRTA